MSYVRSTKVEIQGAEIRIGSLTIGQVRELFAGKSESVVVNAPAPGTPSDYYGDPVFDNLFRVICYSLNNVRGYFQPVDPIGKEEIPAMPKDMDLWNKARCVEELDGPLLLPLHLEIIHFTGLKTQKDVESEAQKKPGESNAA